jgi:hypothetical protein
LIRLLSHSTSKTASLHQCKVISTRSLSEWINNNIRRRGWRWCWHRVSHDGRFYFYSVRQLVKIQKTRGISYICPATVKSEASVQNVLTPPEATKNISCPTSRRCLFFGTNKQQQQISLSTEAYVDIYLQAFKFHSG